METYGLGMDDLFEDQHDISDDTQDPVGSLNQLDDPVNQDEAGQEQEGGDLDQADISREVAERLKNLKAGAAKKRVLRPQPKLDPARLTGERGIPILPNLLENVKFKGKGHEVADLTKMMGKIEHWAHRLFPKMPFNEVIERIERLGQKRAVQTVVNKIRLDMPILSEDFVIDAQDKSDDEQENTTQTNPDGDEPDIARVGDNNTDYDEALNDMMEAEQEMEAETGTTDRPVASTPHPNKKILQPKPPTPAMEITVEQMERMKQNQELAKQRRLQRAAEMKAKFTGQHSLNASDSSQNNSHGTS